MHVCVRSRNRMSTGFISLAVLEAPARIGNGLRSDTFTTWAPPPGGKVWAGADEFLPTGLSGRQRCPLEAFAGQTGQESIASALVRELSARHRPQRFRQRKRTLVVASGTVVRTPLGSFDAVQRMCRSGADYVTLCVALSKDEKIVALWPGSDGNLAAATDIETKAWASSRRRMKGFFHVADFTADEVSALEKM